MGWRNSPSVMERLTAAETLVSVLPAQTRTQSQQRLQKPLPALRSVGVRTHRVGLVGARRQRTNTKMEGPRDPLP